MKKILSTLNSYLYDGRQEGGIDITKNKDLLRFSSTFFLVPSLIAFKQKKKIAINYLLTSIISYIYWNNPKKGLRLNLDITNAIITCIIQLIKAIREKKIKKNKIIFSLIIYSYIQSHHTYRKKKNYWVYYHFLFHVYISIGKIRLLN